MPRSASDPNKWLPKQKKRCLPHRDWWLRHLDRFGAGGRKHILPHDTDRRRGHEIQTGHPLAHDRGRDCWPLTSTLAAQRCRPPPHGCDASSIPELRGATWPPQSLKLSPIAKSHLLTFDRPLEYIVWKQFRQFQLSDPVHHKRTLRFAVGMAFSWSNWENPSEPRGRLGGLGTTWRFREWDCPRQRNNSYGKRCRKSGNSSGVPCTRMGGRRRLRNSRASAPK